MPDALPFLLDQSRFADRASPAERRELLFSLLAEPIKADKVLAKVRMLGGDVGFAEKVIAGILPRTGQKTELAVVDAFGAFEDSPVDQAKNKLLALLSVLEAAHSSGVSLTNEDVGALHDHVTDSLILLGGAPT